MKKISLTLLAIFALAFASCSEDDGPTSSSAQTIELDLSNQAAYSYYPLEVGNYWIYETEYTNADGTPYDGYYAETLKNSIDSAYIERAVRYQGKDAFELVSQVNGQETRTYIAIENDMVFTYQEVTEEQKEANRQQEQQGGFVIQPEGWIPLFNSTLGSVNTIWFEEFDQNNQGMRSFGHYDYKFTTARESSTQIMGNNIDVLEADYVLDFDMNFEMQGQPMEFPFDIGNSFVGLYGKNVGMISMEYDMNGFNPMQAMMEEMGSMPDGFEIPVLPVRKQTLIRYSVQ